MSEESENKTDTGSAQCTGWLQCSRWLIWSFLTIIFILTILLAGALYFIFSIVEFHHGREVGIFNFPRSTIIQDYENAGTQYDDNYGTLKTDSRFHKLVLKPRFYALPFNGYLIGIEGKKEKDLFVSHIGRFQQSGSGDGNWTTCFIHNVYFRRHLDCEDYSDRKEPQDPKSSEIGFQPIEYLKKELRTVIKDSAGAGRPVTHIIVFSTGFNTPQLESLANYTDLYLKLVKAARDDHLSKSGFILSKLFNLLEPQQVNGFNPLFIGISWNSYSTRDTTTRPGMVAGFFNKPSELIDYVNAASRADMIGKELAASLLKEVLLPMRTDRGPRIVLIGHSLGARILSRAAYNVELNEDDQGKKIDLLVGLQGAFRFKRYISPTKGDRNYYENHKKFVDTAIYTTSENDDILNLMAIEVKKKLSLTSPWIYIGSKLAWKTAKDGHDDRFAFAKLDSQGSIKDKRYCKSDLPVLVNADKIITHIIPGTDPDGGAHSDIYKKEIGRFLWEAIRDCTMMPAQPDQ